MALSQAYLEWQREAKREGLEQGRQETLRSTVMNLMQLRYGTVDLELEAIVPRLMAMENVAMMRLLLECSRDEVVQFFIQN
jgi:hypothetical protein